MTALLVVPTKEEISLMASKIGLPPLEAEKFYHFYESKGWMIGKTKMKSANAALAGWKLRWQERQERQRNVLPAKVVPPAKERSHEQIMRDEAAFEQFKVWRRQNRI